MAKIIQKNSVIQINREPMVILPLKEYDKLRESAMPTYYLKGKDAEALDKLVKNGLKDHREGKTIKASSLKGALRIYEKDSKN